MRPHAARCVKIANDEIEIVTDLWVTFGAGRNDPDSLTVDIVADYFISQLCKEQAVSAKPTRCIQNDPFDVNKRR
jgi:hypothetical protein